VATSGDEWRRVATSGDDELEGKLGGDSQGSSECSPVGGGGP
jgi:hypothetical protein